MALVDGVMVAMLPPDGYMVDFENPQRQGVEIGVLLVGIGLTISFLAVVQRLYTKLRITNSFNLEDIMFLISWALSVALQGMIWHMYTQTLVGVHIWEMPITNVNRFLLFLTIAAALFCPASAGAKLSLLLFYHRMTPSTRFIWATRITSFIVVVSYTIISFSLIFGCRPIQGSWDVTLEASAVCLDRSALFVTTAIAGCVSDLLIIALPIPIVAKLNMPLRPRIGIILIFSVGTLTLITSLVRFGMLFYTTSSADQPWVIALVLPTVNVEANLLVVCASITTVPQFLSHIAPRLLGDISYGSKGNGANNLDLAKNEVGIRRSLRTWGASFTNKRRYDKFGDVEYDLGTILAGHNVTVEGGRNNVPTPKFQSLGHKPEFLHSVTDGEWDGKSIRDDGGSERRMLQVKTSPAVDESRSSLG
ncbi:hypothetical protein BX600DRAFT_507246 [Xylariales sp. PMI_506]|nr:hypothetical protein BX600DRAFT_507246 [Xylariales sp. PMI_506]